ncbi:MAG: hypothetical protein R2708_14335 [Vicinamibacterales bacterium]
MSARRYELVYIMKPEATEAEVAELQSQVEAIIGRVGGHAGRPRRGAGASSPTTSASTRKASTCCT